MADSLEKVVRDTIETAMGSAALLTAARKVIAPRMTYLITEHAQAGKFLGGGSQEGSGYSEKTLPAFFLGDLTKSGGQWKLQSHELNKTVEPKQSDLVWRKDSEGNPNAFLLGGYREFRRLAGRSTDFVNLTFTGRMLGSVTSKAKPKQNKVQIETGATGGHEDKAGYTDAMYEWLGLFDDERKDIRSKLETWIDGKVDDRPNETITPSG